MWPMTTAPGPVPHSGSYQFIDGSIANFGMVNLNTFMISGSTTLPNLPAGLSWQVELTSSYIRLYVQGNLAMGSGTWTNAAGDSNWSTSTSASSNWSTGPAEFGGPDRDVWDVVRGGLCGRHRKRGQIGSDHWRHHPGG